MIEKIKLMGKVRELKKENERIQNVINMKLQLMKQEVPDLELNADILIKHFIDYFVLFRNNEVQLLKLNAIDKLTEIIEIDLINKK